MVTQPDTSELRAVANAQRRVGERQVGHERAVTVRNAAMVDALAAGATVAQIARAAGLTIEAVSKALGRRDAKRPPATAEAGQGVEE